MPPRERSEPGGWARAASNLSSSSRPNKEVESLSDQEAKLLELLVGHPRDKWETLKERVQQQDLRKFSDVAENFLDVLWCLDQYRVKGLPPRDMGKSGTSAANRLSGAYRMKGGWFAELLGLLLENQTSSPLAPRSNVQGFSQIHQIDIAWPARMKPILDPLVCVETKVMGGPAFGTTAARGATSDWSNRRKELKFQATDLKLYRRQQETHIDHWDNWRKSAPPKVYFMWCARMHEPKDNLDSMIAEVRALTETYLDGAGIFAFRPNKNDDGYEPVRIPQRDRVVDLDDLVHRVANEINDLSLPGGEVPPPQIPTNKAVDVAELEPDGGHPGE